MGTCTPGLLGIARDNIDVGIYTTAQVDSSVWTLEILAAKGEQETRKAVLKSCLV